MIRWHPFILLWAIIGCQTESPRRIEVLFLGHNSTHHNSEKYMPLLASALTKRGINLTYTSLTDDLNSEKLSLYDALMIYANHDSLTSAQEKALLNFVSEGKGFLPIHCASWCFRNSEAYINLVGGQFKSHETGIVHPEIIDQQHPITQGLETFEAFDETYVHDKLNPNYQVLMERVEGDHREPWTWVGNHGKGRVFYTASGHDERVWSNPGFHQLIFRGIVWAVGDELGKQLERLQIPQPDYTSSENIANYEKRAETLKLQAPLTTQESKRLIQVPPEFDLETFAAEPDIVNPIFFNWDERGRLWVIETVDYPNEVKPEDQGDDRIKICEDTNGDGKADKFIVFADGLNIPTSLVFAKEGVIVSAAPDFLYLKDTDGDDRADTKEKLISGWGTFDTHAGPSNLKYGFDNYIWGTVGYSAFEGVIAGMDFEFSQGIYRFKPDASDFEVVTPTSNNTWGLGFSETFDVFASTANNAHSWYLGIPQRYFTGVEGIPAVGSKKIADYYAYHPITLNFRQVDVFGGFTAAAGHNLYTARSFPPDYWNRVAFICEPTGHLLAKGALVKDGAGFVLNDEWNFLASSDEWVSPVHAEVGPDGAIWVADWYNFIIQHNPTPTPERGGYQAETGAGNAHVNPLRDRSRGRIYRVVYRQAPDYNPLKLDRGKPAELLEALGNDNLFWRLTAQRLLVERQSRDVVNSLVELISNESTDTLGMNPAALHALWTLHGLGTLSGGNQVAMKAATQALSHPAAGVRKAAIQVLPKTRQTGASMVMAGVLDDPDAHTQLAALLAMAEIPPDIEVGELLYDLSRDDELAKDLWRSQAVSIAANRHKTGFVRAFETDDETVEYHIPEETDIRRVPSAWQKWDNPEKIVAEWPSMEAGRPWEESALPGFDGRVLLYQEFRLDRVPQEASIHLGRIGQTDHGFVNGTMIHETRNDSERLRVYQIAPTSLQVGLNYIIVRIEDERGAGGLLGPEEEMYFLFDQEKIALTNRWKYHVLERKSRGINTSDLMSGAELAARFVAFNAGQGAQASPDEDLAPPGMLTLKLGVLKNQMRFDQDELSISAGQILEIEFTNSDFLQHNLLIAAPGSLERVGTEADRLAQSPDGLERQYVPRTGDVLFATGLVDPGKTAKLRFTAPQEPGEYLFICTFPGHWRTMNGILRVLP